MLQMKKNQSHNGSTTRWIPPTVAVDTKITRSICAVHKDHFTNVNRFIPTNRNSPFTNGNLSETPNDNIKRWIPPNDAVNTTIPTSFFDICKDSVTNGNRFIPANNHYPFTNGNSSSPSTINGFVSDRNGLEDGKQKSFKKR